MHGGAVVAEAEFRATYDGPGLIDGRMEVRDLAPALLALADVFAVVHEQQYPGDPRVSLQIKATEPGSFDVHLVLTQVEMAQRILTSDPATALVNLKELVISPAVGVFALVKRMRGRRIQRRQDDTPQPGQVTLTLDDGTTLAMPRASADSVQNVTVRQRVEQVVQPLLRSGVDALRLTTDKTTTVEINPQDVESFDHRYATDEAATELSEPVEVDWWLTIETPQLEPGTRRWRFNDGEGSFSAQVDDEAFLGRVATREVTFGRGDLFHCKVRKEQKVKPDGSLTTTYTVVKVLKVKPGPQPEELPFS